MKIDQTLAAAALAPALQRFWALSGAKIDLILKEYDPAKGSPVFTAELSVDADGMASAGCKVCYISFHQLRVRWQAGFRG